jgi:hypothetical protein
MLRTLLDKNVPTAGGGTFFLLYKSFTESRQKLILLRASFHNPRALETVKKDTWVTETRLLVHRWRPYL